MKEAWNSRCRADAGPRRFKQQRVAFAQSVKAGDTSVQADYDRVRAPRSRRQQSTLRAYSAKLTRPIFFPKRRGASRVRIAGAGAADWQRQEQPHRLERALLQYGFDGNAGSGVRRRQAGSRHGAARLLVAGRSVGRFRPAEPEAERHLAPDGPVTGDVTEFINGNMDAPSAFPTRRSATCRCRCCSAAFRSVR